MIFCMLFHAFISYTFIAHNIYNTCSSISFKSQMNIDFI